MIEFRRQRVRAQTKLHERFGFRHTRGGKSMVNLIALHGFMRVRVPLAAGLPLKVSLANQRLLNLLGALRLHVDPRQALLSAQRVGTHRGCMFIMRSRRFVLGGVGAGMIGRLLGRVCFAGVGRSLPRSSVRRA